MNSEDIDRIITNLSRRYVGGNFDELVHVDRLEDVGHDIRLEFRNHLLKRAWVSVIGQDKNLIHKAKTATFLIHNYLEPQKQKSYKQLDTQYFDAADRLYNFLERGITSKTFTDEIESLLVSSEIVNRVSNKDGTHIDFILPRLNNLHADLQDQTNNFLLKPNYTERNDALLPEYLHSLKELYHLHMHNDSLQSKEYKAYASKGIMVLEESSFSWQARSEAGATKLLLGAYNHLN